MLELSQILEFAVLVAKIAAVVGLTLLLVAYSVLAERKVSAMIQERVGPNRVGIPFINFGSSIGLGQPVIDGLKLILKEDFVPAHVQKFYYWLAPALAMMPPLITLSAIPFGSVIDLRPLGIDIATRAVIADVNVGILLVFAVTSLSVYGLVLAGWSSNSKYPFLGGIRSGAQLISYELAMGLSVVPIFLVVGDLNLSAIVEYQKSNGWFALPFVSESFTPRSFAVWPVMLISFVIFMVAAFAETNRLPFDLPESETELVGGYHTEYSSMKFGCFFLGEYAAMIVAASLMVTLFFGGWSLPAIGMPLIPDGAGNPFWGFVNIATFGAKMAGFIIFFIWMRWTLPRFRYDQLMSLGWKVFLPLALANVMLAALVVGLT